jgi:hypothetical protein
LSNVLAPLHSKRKKKSIRDERKGNLNKKKELKEKKRMKISKKVAERKRWAGGKG